MPALKRKGGRWWACCPFHDEDTPSFSVNSQMGIWHCFGACSEGGDQISFLQKLDGLSFIEAVEILAARTGVDLPRKRGQRHSEEDDAGLAALQAADELFQAHLYQRDGRPALDYLRGRGLGENTLKAFGLGYAPGRGALARLARQGSADAEAGLKAFQDSGLVRRGDDGQPYDFFHQRLTIPIRDPKAAPWALARAVSTRGREARGPKYINSSETRYFHKGRLIYGLDRAAQAIRQQGHAVLVEGYTDVMAAHQVGLAQVVAVLGTSTTSDHAALLRRHGARRVSLVFDGTRPVARPACGPSRDSCPWMPRSTWLRLPQNQDPCDLLVQRGAEAFQAELEMAQDWFEFLLEGLDGLTGAELAREVDVVLELLMALPKPVHRESQVGLLAQRLGLPLESVREQWRSLPARRRGVEGRAASRTPAAAGSPWRRLAPAPAPRPEPSMDPITRKKLVRALEFGGQRRPDRSQPPAGPAAAARLLPPAELQEVTQILDVLFDLVRGHRGRHRRRRRAQRTRRKPARQRVVPLFEYASKARNPQDLFEGSLATLEYCDRSHAQDQHLRAINELQARVAEGDDAAAAELEAQLSNFSQTYKDEATAPSS